MVIEDKTLGFAVILAGLGYLAVKVMKHEQTLKIYDNNFKVLDKDNREIYRIVTELQTPKTKPVVGFTYKGE